ncbi:MAG: bacillithiol biosynthesis deacetylase BshB1 [Sphingomonadales bacterium]|nr:bacillithiol biosynthesis deacetylase BshB1 [Sphingomonadales bacterium]
MIDILAFGAHPDDVELAAGGTLIHHIKAGAKVVVVDLTAGELGTRGNAETRAAEAEESRKIMGVDSRINLGLRDGLFENDEASLIKVVAEIRHFRPRVVMANALTDRHPDHGRAATLVGRACFLAGLPKVLTHNDGIEQAVWRPDAVYHYIQDRYIKPDFVVDISDSFSQKMQAIRAFATQFYRDGDDGPQTPISSAEFLYFIEARARELGHSIGVEFGEGFTSERPLGISNLLSIQ